MTPKQAAAQTGVPLPTLYRWIQAVPGIATKVQGRWEINFAALDRLLKGELSRVSRRIALRRLATLIGAPPRNCIDWFDQHASQADYISLSEVDRLAAEAGGQMNVVA